MALNHQATTTAAPPAKETAKEVASRSADEAKQLSSEALDGARRLVRTGRTEVRDQLQQQTSRAAGATRTAASQLLALAEGDTEHADRAQALVRDVGSRLSQLADRLETGGFDSIAREASSFARRRPMAFLAGMAAAGFVAGRYAKVLKERDDEPEAFRSPGGNGWRSEPMMGRPADVPPTLPVDPVTGTPMVGTDPSGTAYGVSTAPGSSLGPSPTAAGFDAPPTGVDR
jgi:hypothetical protein